MLNDEYDLRQQLDIIANQSQTVILLHERLQQFEIEMSQLRTDIIDCRAIIQRQAELIAVQRAMIHELLASVSIR